MSSDVKYCIFHHLYMIEQLVPDFLSSVAAKDIIVALMNAYALAHAAAASGANVSPRRCCMA